MSAARPTAPSGHEIAKLWTEAPSLMPHGAGCSCAGHVAIHLDPLAVEADILDYLEGRYSAGGETELARFIARRRSSRGITFASWLGSLETAGLSVEASEALRRDLAATISSLAHAHGGVHW